MYDGEATPGQSRGFQELAKREGVRRSGAQVAHPFCVLRVVKLQGGMGIESEHGDAP